MEELVATIVFISIIVSLVTFNIMPFVVTFIVVNGIILVLGAIILMWQTITSPFHK